MKTGRANVRWCEPRENSLLHWTPLLIPLLLDGGGLKIAQLTIANLNPRRPSVTLGVSAYDDRQWQLCRCLSEGVEAKSEQWLQNRRVNVGGS